jgi:hypothetical protein
MQLGQENYLLPVDIHLEDEISLDYGAVRLSSVMKQIEQLSKIAVIIIDACRDNPFAQQLADADPTRSLGVTRGLARMSPTGNGTIIAYAAAPGAVASDGEGEHSPFTQALLDEMEKPGVEIGLVFRRVTGKVIEATQGEQRPETVIRLASEYYFTEIEPAVVVQAAAAGVGPFTAVAPAEVPPVDPIAPNPAAPAPAPVVADPAEDTARQAAAAVDLPSATDRAALWGYMAALSDSPLDAPLEQWVAPERVQVAEIEPNDSFGSAQAVQATDEIEMAIGVPGDTDWYRLAVQQGGTLTVRAPTTPAEIDLAVRLLSANGDELVYWVPVPRPGGELVAEFDLPRPGSYWLQLIDNNNDQASTESFPLELEFVVQADGLEPNDKINLAKHLPLDGTAQLSILPRGDQDWFKYTTDAPGSLLVSLTGVPENIDGTFRLLNSDGVELYYWVTAPRPGGDTVAVFDLPRPGVYYLTVVDNANDSRSPEPLTLTTRFAKSPDLYEPNDGMGQAMPVREQGEHTMAIFPKGDHDFLELNIVQPGELTVAIATPPENLDLTYRVLDGNGAEVQYWTVAPRPGGDLAGSVDFGKPGRYFLEFADSNNDATSIEPFNLALGFTASLDAFEPNDAIGSARVLTPGGEVPLTMFPRADADWFRVTVSDPGELAVTIDEGPANLDLTYRVVNTDWNELAYWVPPYSQGGLTEGFVDFPLAGTYFIEVRDGANDARSIEPATLQTMFTPTPGSNEPNNAFGEATPVNIEGETMAHILPRGDADWHVFYAPGPGELDVTIDEVPENLDISFRLLNADKAEIQYWIAAPRPGGETTGTVTIPSAGWYWMELRDGGDSDRSPSPFRVTRTFRAVAG